MTISTHQAKCARCNVPLEGSIPDLQPNDRVACPTCGEGDTLENVTREIGEYVASKMSDKIGSMFEDAFRGSQVFTVEKKLGPQKRYRFVIDYEPPR
jgi:hypothetical protein